MTLHRQVGSGQLTLLAVEDGPAGEVPVANRRRSLEGAEAAHLDERTRVAGRAGVAAARAAMAQVADPVPRQRRPAA